MVYSDIQELSEDSMNAETRQKIETFLQDQMANADALARAYVFDETGKKRLNRNIFVRVRAHVRHFLEGDRAQSWCIITGLRGAGKTTILMQIFSSIQPSQADSLFLSVDKITQLLGVSLYDVLQVYEDISGSSFERRTRPLILFIDEAQYDEKWNVTLRDIYNRARHNVFIFVTGSAALALNMNRDRRHIFEKMYPLSFTEYIKLKYGKTEERGLGSEVREALFESKNAHEVKDRFLALQSRINKYYQDIGRQEVKNYLVTGALPSVIFMRERMAAFEQVQKSLDRIINTDIARFYNFKNETIRKIATVLYLLSASDTMSYDSLNKEPVGLDRHTAKDVLDALVQTETLIRVPAYTASHSAQVRKPAKYLFMAPIFRAAYFTMIGSVLAPDDERGKLLEDVVGATLHRVLSKTPTSFITYDAQSGGADFIFGTEGKKIGMEVGIGKKDMRQVKQTAQRVNPAYSLIMSADNKLLYGREINAIKIPLKYFLLT